MTEPLYLSPLSNKNGMTLERGVPLVSQGSPSVCTCLAAESHGHAGDKH